MASHVRTKDVDTAPPAKKPKTESSRTALSEYKHHVREEIRQDIRDHPPIRPIMPRFSGGIRPKDMQKNDCMETDPVSSSVKSHIVKLKIGKATCRKMAEKWAKEEGRDVPDTKRDQELSPNTSQTEQTRENSSIDLFGQLQETVRNEMRKDRAFRDEIKKELKKEVRQEVQRDMNKTKEAIREEMDRKYAKREAIWLNKEWEQKIVSKTRKTFQIGASGEDEMQEQVYADPEHCVIALRIIRRCNFDDKLVRKIYVPMAEEEIEREIPFIAADSRNEHMIEVFIKLAKRNPLTYEESVEVSQESGLSTRREVLRCLVSHPYYKASDAKKKIEMRQELIKFFDRHFTAQVGLLTATSAIDGQEDKLLLLGADNVLFSGEGLTVPSRGPALLAKMNRETWNQSRGL